MDTQRLSQGQMISGIAGVLLFISLFLKWFGADSPGAGISGVSFSGWEFNNALDIYLFILAVFAILPALSELSGASIEVPFVDAAAAFLLSVIGLIMTAYVFIDAPDGASRGIGIWLALLTVIAIVIGSYQAMNEEVSRR
jgi:hypothetical protein